LTELLITVAMIGILAALGMMGLRRYLSSAQSSEAKAVIGGIRGGEEAYRAEMMVYVGPSLTMSDFYPNLNPNNTRKNWIQPGDTRFTNSTQGWALLNVNTDGPVRFGYAAMAGIGGQLTKPDKLANPPSPMPSVNAGVPWYVIQAACDHDGNSKFAVFAASSVSAEIISENEQE
jgi:type IV pilus assembly protein PilA